MQYALPKIGLGTAALAGLYNAVNRETAMKTLEEAWALGIRYYDTAPHYGQGRAERVLGDFLREQRSDSYRISTKVGRLLAPSDAPHEKLNGFVDPLPFDQRYDYSYDGIMRSYEDSLQRLGINRVDILFVHDIGVRTHGPKHKFYLDQLKQDGFLALEKLKRSGAVSSIGIGVNEVEICEEILSFQPLDLILLAGRYTLLDRSAEARLLDICLSVGTRLIIGGVFNSGILATGGVKDAHWDYGPAPEHILRKVQALSAICDEHALSLPHAALAFPLRHNAVSTILLGNGKPDHLKENVTAIKTTDVNDQFWEQASKIVLS